MNKIINMHKDRFFKKNKKRLLGASIFFVVLMAGQARHAMAIPVEVDADPEEIVDVGENTATASATGASAGFLQGILGEQLANDIAVGLNWVQDHTDAAASNGIKWLQSEAEKNLTQASIKEMHQAPAMAITGQQAITNTLPPNDNTCNLANGAGAQQTAATYGDAHGAAEVDNMNKTDETSPASAMRRMTLLCSEGNIGQGGTNPDGSPDGSLSGTLFKNCPSTAVNQDINAELLVTTYQLVMPKTAKVGSDGILIFNDEKKPTTCASSNCAEQQQLSQTTLTPDEHLYVSLHRFCESMIGDLPQPPTATTSRDPSLAEALNAFKGRPLRADRSSPYGLCISMIEERTVHQVDPPSTTSNPGASTSPSPYAAEKTLCQTYRDPPDQSGTAGLGIGTQKLNDPPAFAVLSNCNQIGISQLEADYLFANRCAAPSQFVLAQRNLGMDVPHVQDLVTNICPHDAIAFRDRIKAERLALMQARQFARSLQGLGTAVNPTARPVGQ